MELIEIFSGIGAILSNEFFIFSGIIVIIMLFFFLKVVSILTDRLKESDKNNKEVTIALRGVCVQLERVATMTEVQGGNLREVKSKIDNIEGEVKELWREKEDRKL